MKKEIEFIEEEESIYKVIFTKSYLLDHIKKHGLISTVREYNIPEDFISDNIYEINKTDFMRLIESGNYVVSETFLEKLIDDQYLKEIDIYNLSMTTYSGLNQWFVKKYYENINWERMMTYLLSCDKIDNMDVYKEVIEKYNMWPLISASPLSIEFIRENKDKLSWNFVGIMIDFTEEEEEEFRDYIVDRNVTTFGRVMEEQFKSFEDISMHDLRNDISSISKSEMKVNIANRIDEEKG